ncbi:ELMO domain-containing protein 3-like [Diadema antillarum]|uniref:ELMO domain-containing protein 3-like n=1 Tax=Diadema antillarum TaxID=105358 RepID=UPI003A84408B
MSAATSLALSDAGPGHNGDDDDDFNGIIEDDGQATAQDSSSFAAVNYKVSIEQYEKVDVFQTSSAISEQTLTSTTTSSQKTEFSSTEISQETGNLSPSPTQPAAVEQPNDAGPEEETQTLPNSSVGLAGGKTSSADPSVPVPGETPHAVSTAPTVVVTGDPIVVNGSSPADGKAEKDGNTTPSDSILKAEVGRTTVEPSEQLLRAQAEWDAVETIQPGSVSPGKHSAVRKAPMVSFNEALGFFQTSNMEPYLQKIKPCIERSGFAAIRHMILGPPRISKGLMDERNLVFAIAQYPFDDEQQIHKRVLQTIYKQLTGSTIDCPRYGSHWEQIGFQGTDPSTDLRACGFLGLLTLLDFVMDSQKFPLAKDIYRLSQHETQNFPFCVMSINMTRIALQTLREEHLSRECNRRKQVFGVINDFFASIFLQLYQVWKQQRKTIHDSGFVLKELEASCKKNPRTLMRNLELHLVERSTRGGDSTPRGGVPSNSPAKSKSSMDFAGVHELDDSRG